MGTSNGAPRRWNCLQVNVVATRQWHGELCLSWVHPLWDFRLEMGSLGILSQLKAFAPKYPELTQSTLEWTLQLLQFTEEPGLALTSLWVLLRRGNGPVTATNLVRFRANLGVG